MDSENKSYVQKLKRRAFVNGLDLICLSIHQNSVSPDKNVRQEQIDHTLRCIKLAYVLSIPCILINSRRWDTVGYSQIIR
jgi:sugar phosphate isomerase/epimerase